MPMAHIPHTPRGAVHMQIAVYVVVEQQALPRSEDHAGGGLHRGLRKAGSRAAMAEEGPVVLRGFLREG